MSKVICFNDPTSSIEPSKSEEHILFKKYFKYEGRTNP